MQALTPALLNNLVLPRLLPAEWWQAAEAVMWAPMDRATSKPTELTHPDSAVAAASAAASARMVVCSPHDGNDAETDVAGSGGHQALATDRTAALAGVGLAAGGAGGPAGAVPGHDEELARASAAGTRGAGMTQLPPPLLQHGAGGAGSAPQAWLLDVAWLQCLWQWLAGLPPDQLPEVPAHLPDWPLLPIRGQRLCRLSKQSQVGGRAGRRAVPDEHANFLPYNMAGASTVRLVCELYHPFGMVVSAELAQPGKLWHAQCCGTASTHILHLGRGAGRISPDALGDLMMSGRMLAVSPCTHAAGAA